MPIYTYKCENCDNTFDAKQSMLDDPLEACILCSDGKVRRVINNVGIVFKGNGFYVTDNRGVKRNGATSGEGANGATSEASTTPSENKSESKSENSSVANTEKSSSSNASSATA